MKIAYAPSGAAQKYGIMNQFHRRNSNKYEEKPVTVFLVQDVHPRFLKKGGLRQGNESKKYKLNQRTKKDEKIAREMTSFLSNFKKSIHEGKNSPFNNEVNRTILVELKEVLKNQKDLDINNFFRVIKSNKNDQGLDFEKEFDKLMESIFRTLPEGTRKDFQFRSTSFGQKQASIEVQKDIIAEIGGDVNKVKPEVIKTLVNTDIYTFNKNTQQAFKKRVTATDGKIDNSVVQDLKIEATTTNQYEKIFNYFLNRNFSLKSYAEVQKGKKRSISLGHSGIPKTIIGVLQSLGFNLKTSESCFYAGLNVLAKEADSDVSTHFGHLRYFFELSGAGFNYGRDQNLLGKSGQVDFLIVNNPATNDIKVISVAKILKDNLKFYDEGGAIQQTKRAFDKATFSVL